MKKKVFVLGNEIYQQDSMPIQLLPNLRKLLPKIEFLHIDPTEEFTIDSNGDLVILDTVMGISNTAIFTDLSLWKRSPRVTAHDFDLPVSLGILKKLGKIKSIKIIAVPSSGNKKRIVTQVVNLLKAI